MEAEGNTALYEKGLLWPLRKQGLLWVFCQHIWSQFAIDTVKLELGGGSTVSVMKSI